MRELQVNDKVTAFFKLTGNSWDGFSYDQVKMENVKTLDLDDDHPKNNFVCGKIIKIKHSKALIHVTQGLGGYHSDNYMIAGNTDKMYMKMCFDFDADDAPDKDETIIANINLLVLAEDSLSFIEEVKKTSEAINQQFAAKMHQVKQLIGEMNDMCKSLGADSISQMGGKVTSDALDVIGNLGWSTSSFYC